MSDCIFCRMIRGEVKAYKIYETSHCLCVLTPFPLSRGHAVIIPKEHVESLHDCDPEYLEEVVPLAAKIVLALGLTDYNILQNNGTKCHQSVPHIHFHVIPRTGDNDGLHFQWHPAPALKDELRGFAQGFRQICGE